MFSIGKSGLATIGALVLAGSSLVGGLRAARASNPVLPAYFNPADANVDAPIIFMRHSPPPADDQGNKTNYAYGPLTDSVAQNVAAQNRSTWTGGNNWAFVWANSAHVPPGDRPAASNTLYPPILDANGLYCQTEFTTVARADAATKAEVLYIMGARPSVWQAPLTAVGINAIPWATVNADPDAYCTQLSQDGNAMVMIDKMVIPTTVSTSANGIGIDYEVQDFRTPSETHPFLDDLGQTIRSYGLKAYLYTNPWDSPSPALNGFAFDRMDDIKANFDYINLLVWGGKNQCIEETSYPTSVAFLKGVSGKLNFNQIIITVDLLHCSAAEASLIADQRDIDHFVGYDIWDDGAVDGGSTLTGSNLVIYKLLHPDGD
ncbi:MAG: hypothetical protein M3T55_07070 [Pseudomonadota bacterium]|nr:hypothetical protein [Pseudomonadota bacterium]